MHDRVDPTGIDGGVRLHDTDHAAVERNARFGNWVQRTEDVAADWTYEAVADRERALAGADVVVLSTQYDPRETFSGDADRSGLPRLCRRHPGALSGPWVLILPAVSL